MKRSLLLYYLMAGAVLALLPPVAMAADQEYVYHQATGKVTLGDTEMGQGYSGKGDAKNNPDKETLKKAGPIPRGLYTIGNARLRALGRLASQVSRPASAHEATLPVGLRRLRRGPIPLWTSRRGPRRASVRSSAICGGTLDSTAF
jgi:hypothetical protein